MEKRNAKVTEMKNLVNKATEEDRVLNSDEKEKFNALEKEVRELDTNIDAINTANALTLTPAKEPTAEPRLSVEDRERKQFENIIRGIKNADDPTTYDDGKVTIPTTIASRIIDAVVEISPIYQLADRYNLKGTIVLPKYDANNSSIEMKYADEGTSAESGKAKLVSIELKGYLGRCLAKISNSLINNSEFDIVSFVIAKMAQAIAEFIEKELLIGTAGKIEGLRGIESDMTINTDSSTTITGDDLMDTQDLVVDKYQSACIWIMNKATRNAIRKLKDREGNYILNRDFTAKWGYSLLGKDVYCSDNMPKIEAGKVAVYYGDFSGLAVKTSEDVSMQILRERYAEEHQTGVLAFVEMDAKVADSQKISRLVVGSTVSL